MSYQRKRNAIPARFHPVVKRIDGRGNERKLHDPDTYIDTTVWVFPQRGAKAEVTGQQTVNVVRIGCQIDMPGVELGARVLFLDKEWDVVSPPSWHHGVSRHTRHYSMDVRERP